MILQGLQKSSATKYPAITEVAHSRAEKSRFKSSSPTGSDLALRISLRAPLTRTCVENPFPPRAPKATHILRLTLQKGFRANKQMALNIDIVHTVVHCRRRHREIGRAD